ncbi:MAG: ATP-dependent RecD-like DNA helicase [Bdellovibrionales bacterium]
MSDFTPSSQQAEAMVKIKDWFQNRTKEQQIFRVMGYAGTGKTTMVTHVVKELGLKQSEHKQQGSVLYAAFTGKAALVMSRKGTPASTIHSLIYRVSSNTPAEMERIKDDIAVLKASLSTLSGDEKLFAKARISRLETRLRNIHLPSFVLNEESQLRYAKLLVLDEVSMVGEELAKDLLSFGKPILVLGDPGQLPPIKGEGAFINAVPDVMLTDIHRQAEESAIIRLATMARKGSYIPYGQHDAFVWKMSVNDTTPAQMLKGGQVICGRNRTRLWLNVAMKDAAGFPTIYPEGCGEKIICLKNRHDLGLVNGMFLELSDLRDEDHLSFSAEVITEDGDVLEGRHSFYKGHYDDHIQFDKDRLSRDWHQMRHLVESVWGYAITCHKAQGSQWENVIIYDDHLCRTMEDQRRWLYTAITRAEKGLVILD